MKNHLSRFLLLLSFTGLSSCVQQHAENGMPVQDRADRAFQSARIHTELAAEYYYRGQLEVAIEEVNEALKAQSNYAPAYSVLGLINMNLNEDGKALENFERAIRMAPRNSEIHNNYGWFLCQRFPQRMDDAISHFMVAAKDPLYPTPEMSFTNAGVCETKRQKYTEAQLFFQNALSIKSSYSPAIIGLIDIDFQRGNLTDAKSKLSQFLQNNTSTAESLLMAIKIERALGNQLAVDSYNFQLQKHFPESKEAAAIREGRIK
ncbi:type IV pilus biogenesis/stability protein PilW [Nitrosomonas supralitoralis]|uniref:Type IV pilus biogenesis/stability protein PilW n=1 Tax=Nitrosomonas supralitoralis TaxID=2116706 RepID=A0A2P7NV50_9PROT|nr:type IV pilus biogenesis/stability protein PilW [Nitrosomonas supralitoralis]PSJ17350.1 type IV pilus biogenesis/stability protein PilW [Nitrosomonas supralitoralis]